MEDLSEITIDDIKPNRPSQRFDAEFRRFAIRINPHRLPSFDEFSETVRLVHGLRTLPFTVTYTDPEGDLLPINNDDNFAKALSTARPLLRLVIQRKGQSEFEINGYGTVQRKRNVISKLIPGDAKPRHHIPIGLPEDFRQVSAIIDVDILPETQRRVKLMRNGSDKPLGFYIRDGASVRVMPHGLEKVPGIFISRLVPGGLAESTGLLAVNDEVLEVNGIEVIGKTLDQVTDMMVANSAKLIITIKPVNQHGNAQSNFEVVSTSDAEDASPNLRVPATLSSVVGADVAEEEEEVARDDDEDEIEEFVVPPENDEDFHSLKDEDSKSEGQGQAETSSLSESTAAEPSAQLL